MTPVHTKQIVLSKQQPGSGFHLGIKKTLICVSAGKSLVLVLFSPDVLFDIF